MARQAILDPSLTSSVSPAGTQVTLVSSEDDTNVRAQVGLEHGNWTTTLRAQAPLRKGAATTPLATNTGLRTGSVGTLQLTYLSMGRHYQESKIFDACDEFNRTAPAPPHPLNIPKKECTKQGILDLISKWNTPAKDALTGKVNSAERDALKSVCDEYNKTGAFAPILPIETACTDESVIRPLLVTADASRDKPEECTITPEHPKRAAECWQQKLDDALAKQFKTVCEAINSDPAVWGQLVETGASTCTYQQLAAKGRIWGDLALEKTKFSPFYLGLSASIKTEGFSFATEPDYLEKNDAKITKYPVSLGGTFGKLLTTTLTYVGLNASVERSFKGADAAQICQPLSGTTTKCRTIALKAPTEANKHIIELEARQYLTENVAINPRVRTDIKNDIDAGEVFVYLFTSDKKGLNGGLDFAYENNRKEKKSAKSITLFVGTTFSLFSTQ